MRYRTAIIIFVFGIAWTIMTLFFDNMIFQRFSAYRRFSQYPVVGGTVIQSQVEMIYGSDGPLYKPKLIYEYTVNSKNIVTEQTEHFTHSFASRERAEQIVTAYPPGTRVNVHYDPQDPAKSAILLDLKSSDCFSIVFMIPFNIAAVLTFAASAAAFLAARRRDEFPFIRISTVDARTIIDFSPQPLIAAAIAYMLVVGIIGVAIGAFLFLPNLAPITPYFIIGECIVLGIVGVLAYPAARRRMARGDDHLVIDLDAGTLTLPKRRGFSRRWHIIPLAEVINITTPRVTGADSGEGYQTYLHFWMDSLSQDFCIHTFSKQADAERFREFLVSRLGLGADAQPETVPGAST